MREFGGRRIEIVSIHYDRKARVTIYLNELEDSIEAQKDFSEIIDTSCSWTTFFLRKHKTGNYKVHLEIHNTNLEAIRASNVYIKTFYRGLRGHLIECEDSPEIGQIVSLRDKEGREEDFQYIPGYFINRDYINRGIKSGARSSLLQSGHAERPNKKDFPE